MRLVQDADHRVLVVDHRDRQPLSKHVLDYVLDAVGHVDRPVGHLLVIARRIHDRADPQHLFARDVAGEPGHVLRCGVEHNVLGLADLLDAAVEHDRDTIREPERLVEVVGDEDDGLLQQGLKAQELVLHLLADERVERGERLVEKPDVGFDRQRPRDSHPLLLPAGKLPRKVVFPALETDEGNHLARPFHVVAALHAPHLQREGDVL